MTLWKTFIFFLRGHVNESCNLFGSYAVLSLPTGSVIWIPITSLAIYLLSWGILFTLIIDGRESCCDSHWTWVCLPIWCCYFFKSVHNYAFLYTLYLTGVRSWQSPVKQMFQSLFWSLLSHVYNYQLPVGLLVGECWIDKWKQSQELDLVFSLQI